MVNVPILDGDDITVVVPPPVSPPVSPPVLSPPPLPIAISGLFIDFPSFILGNVYVLGCG